MSKVVSKVAASSLVIAMTAVGCTPGAQLSRPASIATQAVDADKKEAQLHADTMSAVQKNDLPAALTLAETLVSHAPKDAGYRMILADLYLKNGRFASAATTYRDVLTLQPDSHRAAFSSVLAQIALGRSGGALIELEHLSTASSHVDVGLAFALAGDPHRAIALLEPAARAEGADGRVRQNLALAYALAGDWKKARITAAQDVSPSELEARLGEWAVMADPSAGPKRVTMLLGIEPAADSGQPTRLALAPAVTQPVALATVTTTPVEPVTLVNAPSAPVLPAAPSRVADAAVALQVPGSEDISKDGQYAAAAQALLASGAVVTKASLPVTREPIRPFQRPVRKLETPRTVANGRYVVQLGAYGSARQVEQAWTRAVKAYALGPNARPHSTTITIPGKGTFHRLSVAGFAAPSEAGRLCRSIKARGGACFVRSKAGDALAQWAPLHSAKG